MEIKAKRNAYVFIEQSTFRYSGNVVEVNTSFRFTVEILVNKFPIQF
jgi:hypothetical protein